MAQLYRDKKVTAIIVAAGSSTRMGFDKMLYNIDGKPTISHSIYAFDKHEYIDEIVVVVGENEAEIRKAAPICKKACSFVKGGALRSDSVLNGVMASSGDCVAIHDGARPYVSEAVISAAIETAVESGAAAPAVNVKDTVKVAGADGIVVSTPRRDTLYAVQTPQCFIKKDYIQVASSVNSKDVTDDCSLYELAGRRVVLTQGDYTNIKITTPDDLATRAERGHSKMRIGHGYDVHKLVSDRKLILGGELIPYEKGLLGHSDADVLVHAIMDALLGACAMGDIGAAFPDNDDKFKGADSIELLKQVVKMIDEKGYKIGNIDSTILCQKPKLAPFIYNMRSNIAHAAKLDVECVSVKATTEEKLGFTGEGLGIAAHSVCIVFKK